jgi:hypothetical protein
MSEKQEKVWVVMKSFGKAEPKPAKVFDDRADARAYTKRMRAGKGLSVYWIVGVRKG